MRQGLVFTNNPTSDDTSHAEYFKNIKASETCGNAIDIARNPWNPDFEHVKNEIGELKGKNILKLVD